jgi:hypothetical protein
MQLFSEIGGWKKACMKPMEKLSYVHLCLHNLLIKCDSILYMNIHFLLVFLATLPLTTSSAERSLGALKRIQTYCRSMMVKKRLSGITTAFIHEHVSINLVKILELCMQKHEGRFDFGYENLCSCEHFVIEWFRFCI